MFISGFGLIPLPSGLLKPTEKVPAGRPENFEIAWFGVWWVEFGIWGWLFVVRVQGSWFRVHG